MQLTRRHALLGSLGIAATLAGVDGLVVEPRWLEVTEHEIPVADLPRGLEGFTLVQLTDAHLTGDADWNHTVLEAVRGAAPQLIALTGDMVESAAQLPRLSELGAALQAVTTQIAALYGNWEHWGNIAPAALRRVYAGFGATLLVDEVRTLEGVTLLGTDDGYSSAPDLARLTPARTRPPPRILLTHSPALLDRASRGALPRVDLALAGHTHGGQGRIGTVAPFVPPGSGRFVAGYYETALGPAYVCRGLGMSVVPARLMCRPELAVFRLTRA